MQPYDAVADALAARMAPAVPAPQVRLKCEYDDIRDLQQVYYPEKSRPPYQTRKASTHQ